MAGGGNEPIVKRHALIVTICGVLFLLLGVWWFTEPERATRWLLEYHTAEGESLREALGSGSFDNMLREPQPWALVSKTIGVGWLIAGVGVLIRVNGARLLALTCAGFCVLWELRLSVPSIFTHDIPFLGYLLRMRQSETLATSCYAKSLFG